MKMSTKKDQAWSRFCSLLPIRTYGQGRSDPLDFPAQDNLLRYAPLLPSPFYEIQLVWFPYNFIFGFYSWMHLRYTQVNLYRYTISNFEPLWYNLWKPNNLTIKKCGNAALFIWLRHKQTKWTGPNFSIKWVFLCKDVDKSKAVRICALRRKT